MTNKLMVPNRKNPFFNGQPQRTGTDQFRSESRPTIALHGITQSIQRRSAVQKSQPQAPPVYRPLQPSVAPPPVYRPKQIAATEAQMKPRDPRLETRPAPPVYRPQPQFRPVQGKMAGMVPSPSGSAPPVYKPSPAIAAHPNRYPAIVQLSKKSQEKKEEQKKGKKKAESKLQSRTDRNLNRLGQYQTEDKKRQGERQEKVKELSKQGKNLAHGFGNEQSGKSGKFHQYMKDVNAKGPEKKMTSQEEEFTPSKEKKGTDLQLGGPSVSVRDVRTKAAKVANFRKTREDGVKDYADYCQRNLGTSFGRDKYEKWANEWADTQDWEEPLIPSEHPTKEFEKKEDPDSDNGGGGFGLGFGGPNQEVLVG